MSSLESVWEYREDTLYPRLFGSPSEIIFNVPEATFRRLAPGDVDERWLRLGVIEYPPTAQRNSWLYATSGGSTPWNVEPAAYDPEGYSWLGVELVVESPEQAQWPIELLQYLLAIHVLASHRRIDPSSMLDYGGCLRLQGPISGAGSQLTVVAIVEPRHYPSQARLASGKFDFLQVLGITEAERAFAEANSTALLWRQLMDQGAAPVTDPARGSVALPR